MTLYEGQTGKHYTLETIAVEEEIARRLQALGMIEGTHVKLLNRKKRGALILYVRGTRLALGSHITSRIEVKEDENGG
jgi:ferrous iron transport protein A